MTQNLKLTTLLPMVEKSKNEPLPIRYPEFAGRLVAAMKKDDLKISVTDIKKRLKISYEMARRYTLGQAMPRAENMDALAELVKETPSWLTYGTAVPSDESEETHQSAEKASNQVNAVELAELVTLYVQANSKWKEFILGTARNSTGDVVNDSSRTRQRTDKP